MLKNGFVNELMSNRFHYKNINKFSDWGFDDDDDYD
jgi:hypothetical protein